MNNKEPDYPKNFSSVENVTHRKNGSKQLADLSNEIDNSIASPDNQFMVQLQEMKVRNYQLEKLTEQLKVKLTEVVATNNRFISIIAHDLRSPFHAILGALELVKFKMEEGHYDDLENYIDMASESANRTLRLLDNLLDWTISQHPEKSFNPVKVNMHELVKDEIVSMDPIANQKQLTINHSVAPHIKVTADVQMVKTIIRNLIGNAIKYSKPGGEISVGMTKYKQFVEIAVNDKGIGITKEAQKRLFKIEELHSTKGTNNEHGSGFGLLLCKEFVELHGGTISVESRPGKGSKFKFTLPHYL